MTGYRKFVAVAGAVAAIALLGVASPRLRAKPGAADIVVDLAERHQRMDGWETTIRAWDVNKSENRFDPGFADVADEALRVLVDDAGVNRLRLEIRSGNENREDLWPGFVSGEMTYAEYEARMYDNENDNGDPYSADPAGFNWSDLDYRVETVVLPMRERLAARGETLFVNLCVVDFAKGDPGSLDLATKPEEYAELVAEAFRHLEAKYALTPDALEIVLEPENSGAWKAERLGPAIRAAKKRLASYGFEPQIIAPSTKLARNAVFYFSALRRAGADIDVIAYHSYDRPGDNVRRAIAYEAKKAGVATAMLEHLRADVNEFYADMTVADVSAWQQWGLAHLKDSGNYLLVGDPAKPAGARVRLASRTRYLSEIWRHARIGDVRVGAASADAALKPLAFVRPDGRAVLSVIAAGAREFSIGGLPPGEYAVERTTPAEFAENAGRLVVGADGRARVSMPAAGVVTLYPVGALISNQGGPL